MPITNVKKRFVCGGFYHIYNVGINGERIFFSEKDYGLFINLLESYLMEGISIMENPRKSYHGKVKLLAFCLMPNHFHLLLMQVGEREITEFIQSLSISFTTRINHKYNRRGHLFSSVYKARLLDDFEDILGVSKYIHLNPDKNSVPAAINYGYSSIDSYIYKKSGYSFIDSSHILNNIGGPQVYCEYLYKK